MPNYTKHYNFIKPNKTENYDIEDVTTKNMDILDEELFGKEDKVPGKGLSTNDFTDAYKNKLDELENYDDTEIQDTLSQHSKDILDIKEEQTEQNTKILNLSKENELLKSQIPNGQANGNPIHLTDSSNMSLSYRLNGGSRQESRSGYNKLNLKDWVVFEKRNITLVGDMQENSVQFKTNQSIGSTGYYLRLGNTLPAGTYYFQRKFETIEEGLGSNNYGNAFISKSDWSSELCRLNPSDDKKSFVLDSETEVYLTLTLKGSTDTGTEEREIKYYDLMLSNTDEEYEPYGAMPSPDYPSKIETVGSNANLFDKDNAIILNTSTSDGKLGTQNNNTRTLILPIIGGETYTISKISSQRFAVATLENYGYQEPYVDSVSGLSLTATNCTLKTSLNANYLAVYYYLSTADTLTEQEILDSIKIEKGNKATPYSPYGMGSVEIESVNKNFIKIQEIDKTEIGLDISTNKNVVNINRTATSSTNIYNFFEDIKLKQGTYTFSFISQNAPAINSCQFVFRDENNAGIVTLNGWGETNAKTITLEEDAIISGEKSSFYTNNNITFNNTKYELQIEKGESATEIIEPQSQIKIMPIQQEMLEGDYIEEVEHHEWGKVVLDGTENINLDLTYQGISQFTLNNIKNGKFVDDGKTISALSNYFKGVIWSYSWTKDNSIVIRNDGRGRIMSSEFTTAEQFKTFLQERYAAGTPVIVYYKLATPIDLELTEEQEEAREGFNTYKGVTNISVDNELATLDVTYKKDLETLINNLTNVISSLTTTNEEA